MWNIIAFNGLYMMIGDACITKTTKWKYKGGAENFIVGQTKAQTKTKTDKNGVRWVKYQEVVKTETTSFGDGV